MKGNKLPLVFLFVLLLASLVLVIQEFQKREDERALSNVAVNNTSIHSSKFLENRTPIKGEFKPILTLLGWDFQPFEDRIFVYYNGALKAYEIETGKLLLNITPVYDYYFSNRYAYIKTDDGSFVLDYETLRLAPVDTDKNVKYAFNLGNCRITAREKSVLVNSQIFKFNSTPKIAFFDSGFVVFGLFGASGERVLFFDEKCSLLSDVVIEYFSDFKVFGDRIFFIDKELYSRTLPKFPEIEGEMILHEYLKESKAYLFSSNGTLIANLTLGGAIGFHNDTIYTIYPHGIGKFYLLNKSLEKKTIEYVLYSGWAVVQGVYGDFTEEFISFVYWGFSGEAGTSFSSICVYPYERTIKCVPYRQEAERVSPIDEIKAWDRYFAIIPRGSREVVVYEVR